MKNVKRGEVDTIAVIGAVIITLLVLGLSCGSWIVSSYFESSSFNKLTDKESTTWDAMWTELRVTGE